MNDSTALLPASLNRIADAISMLLRTTAKEI
jgi:hypothetical protein